MSSASGPLRRMLVADDDAAIRDLVTTRLTLAGYTVFTARNGREAMLRMRERRYDGLVLDLNMPELDGFGVLKEMQALGARRPATLVLTARHNADDVRTAIRLGARDYLAKPFQDRQLLLRVGRLFRVAPTPALRTADGRSSLEALLDEAIQETSVRLAR
ncbi:MAG: response regulator [Proteobacteria bacterium]|nr:response regulator [Pseudomonadota bacterium]